MPHMDKYKEIMYEELLCQLYAYITSGFGLRKI